MDHNLKASNSIEINAPAEKVWNVLTNPELIKEYLHGTNTKTSWEEGSPITFEGEYNGHVYKDKGTILKNNLNTILSYSYWSGFSGLEDKPENYSTITYTLQGDGANKTKFTWAQAGFASKEGLEHNITGMPALLKQVKEIAER